MSQAVEVAPQSLDEAHPSDLLRQLVVAGSAVVALVGLAVGLGVFGQPETEDAAGGSLSSTATLIAPAGPAFSIWTPIYAGLVALAIWQLFPARRADPRQRRAGWGIAVTMVANAVWLFVVAAGWIWASVAVIMVLLAALVLVYARLLERPPASRVERVVVDATMGAYLGWVSVATIANVAAALVATGAPAIGSSATIAAVVMLGVAAAIGWRVAEVARGRWAFSLALAWGLVWIAIARSQPPAESTGVVVAAAAAAVVVLVAPAVLGRHRGEA